MPKSPDSTPPLGGFLIFFRSVVAGLLVFVSLLVGLGLLFVGAAVFVAQGLPALTENLADLAKGDTRVLLSDALTLLVGEEHVGRETTLGRIGVLLLLLDTAGLGFAGSGLFLRHVGGAVADAAVRNQVRARDGQWRAR